MRVTVEDATGRKVVIDEAVVATQPQPWDVAGLLVKSEAEQRFTLCVAYPANKADASVAMDGHRDFVSAPVLEQAAWNFLAKSPKVGLFHEDGTEGAGRVVESYVWRAGDWRIRASDGSEQVVKAGDWMVGIIWDQPAWDLIKAGKLHGISMQGSAVRRTPTKGAVRRLRSA